MEDRNVTRTQKPGSPSGRKSRGRLVVEYGIIGKTQPLLGSLQEAEPGREGRPGFSLLP